MKIASRLNGEIANQYQTGLVMRGRAPTRCVLRIRRTRGVEVDRQIEHALYAVRCAMERRGYHSSLCSALLQVLRSGDVGAVLASADDLRQVLEDDNIDMTTELGILAVLARVPAREVTEYVKEKQEMNVLTMARARDLIARAKRIFGTDSDVELAHRAALVVALAGEGKEPGVLAAREVLEALSAAPTEALLAEVGGYDRSFARLKEADAEGGEAIRCV